MKMVKCMKEHKISLEDAKKIVAGRLRLVDERTNLYAGVGLK